MPVAIFQMVDELDTNQTGLAGASTTEAVPIKELQTTARELLDRISGVVLGKRDVAELCLIALLSNEHVLLEDVPGVGKTLMGKALSRCVDGTFRRVQFTPDLLPSDIVGNSIYNTQTAEFEFKHGPVFSNFVLADEINRAPPRTQSALLEAMSDSQVSIDGTTHALAPPFMVIATQNPFEFEGTYVLPESQLDRFLIRTSMGYPDPEFENQIFANHRSGNPVDQIQPVCDWRRILDMQAAVRNVTVDDSIAEYMLEIIRATRDSADLSVGVSTRGGLAWYRAAQGKAFVDGRSVCIPDDAKNLAVTVLSHRVQLRGGLQASRREDTEALIAEITGKVPIPT
ncbi:MAG: MoxR family ATPase [Planctomycetota bacterium]